MIAADAERVVQLTDALTDFFLANRIPVAIGQQALLSVFLMASVAEGRKLDEVLELVRAYWPIIVDSRRRSQQ